MTFVIHDITDPRHQIGGCEFLGGCPSFNDEEISDAWKFHHGCKASTDVYRTENCGHYRCQALVRVVHDILGTPIPDKVSA